MFFPRFSQCLIKFVEISWFLLVLWLKFFDAAKCWGHISGTIFVYLILLCNTFDFFSDWIFWSISLSIIFNCKFLSDLIIYLIWYFLWLMFYRLRILNFDLLYWLNNVNLFFFLSYNFHSIISSFSFCLFLNSIIFFRLFNDLLRFYLFEIIILHIFFDKVSA